MTSHGNDETVDGGESPSGGEQGVASEEVVPAFQSIYDVTMDSDLSFEEKIDRLLSIGVEEMGLPFGFLSQISVDDSDTETGVQTIHRAIGDHDLLQPGQSAPLSNAYCRKTIQTDDLLAIENSLAAGWEGDPAYETFDLGSYIGARVEVDDELYGTFCFASTEPKDGSFSEEERTLVKVLSKWASYELEQERARRDLEEQRDNLKILSQVVRHDIRNDLQLVLAYSEMLESNVEDENVHYVEQVIEAAREAVDITTTAREVADVMLQSDVDRHPKRLRYELEEAVSAVRSSNEHALLTVERPIPDVEVRADDMLESVFRNVLKNAIRHNDKDVPEVRVDAGVDDGVVLVRVADNGPGIPDDRKRTIFEEGEMGLESEGTGLGLYLVDQLVERYNGSVYVEDNDPTGAVFVVELPAVG